MKTHILMPLKGAMSTVISLEDGQECDTIIQNLGNRVNRGNRNSDVLRSLTTAKRSPPNRLMISAFRLGTVDIVKA